MFQKRIITFIFFVKRCIRCINLFIMSFGQHSYQHRYFNDRLKGKESIPRAGASLIPLSYSGNATIIDPVSYDIVRNNRILYNESLRKYIPTSYNDYNDYVYNSLILDQHKRKADYFRKYKRYGTLSDYYDSLPPIRRVATQLPLIQTVIPANPSVVYVNRDNPEAIAALQSYNTILTQKVHEAEREKQRMKNQVDKQKQQVREYRRKYDKLKHRLRNEVNEKVVKAAQQRQRRKFELRKQQQKIEQISHAILAMSQQLNNNSKILDQNIKLRQDLERRELQRQKVLLFPGVPSVLTRSIILDRPKLDSQYKQMNRLKKQIKQLDKKLGYQPKY